MAKSNKVPRWTPAEVKRLHELVESEGTIAAGVRAFAAETNRSEATVLNKWYKLKHAEKPAAPVEAADGWAGANLRSLSTDALVELHHESRREIERRIEALQAVASDA